MLKYLKWFLRQHPRGPTIVVCMRASDLRDVFLETNFRYSCSLCQEMLAIMPSTTDFMDKTVVQLVCRQCFREAGLDAKVRDTLVHLTEGTLPHESY